MIGSRVSRRRPRAIRTHPGLPAGLLAAPAAAQTWIELGPAPTTGFSGATGRVSALVCAHADPNRAYAAGADGGLWRTTDGGASWTPLTDHLPVTAIGAVALHPADDRILYVGTGEANFANHSRYGVGIYRSLDGGDTWEHLAEETFAGRCVSRLIVVPQQPEKVYAAVTQAGGFPARAAARGHPSAQGPRGVFRSDDGGITWTRLPGLPDLCVTDLAIAPDNPQVIFAAVGYIFGHPANGIYRSLDGGSTWTRLAAGLPADTVGRISLAIAPSLSTRLYALITRPADASGGSASARGAFRSDDAGNSWIAIGSGPNQATYGWFLSLVVVHPANPDIVFMGGLDLIRSSNAGASWSVVTPPHVDQHALAFDASGRLWVGCDGGVYRSSDVGATWVSRNAGLGTIQFYAGLSAHPVNDAILLGGTQDNGTARRASASLTWTSVLGGDGGWTQINPTDGTIAFAEFQGTGNLYRSTNSGQSFTFSGSGLSGRNCFLPPYVIDPQNPARLLYATERVWVSTSGGTSWSALSGDVTGGGTAAIRALAIAPSDSAFVYVATNDHRVLASSDGGATFTLRLTDALGWPRVTRELTVHPTDPRTVYLAGGWFGRPHVRRSRDAGASWDVLDGNLPDVPVHTIAVVPVPPVDILYAGTDRGVYRSVTDGYTWRRYGEGLPNAPVVDLRPEPARRRLLAATQGRGAWTVSLEFCYPDFDDDTRLTVADLTAFLQAFAAGESRANCDASTAPPVLNVADFTCFLQRFVAGCP